LQGRSFYFLSPARERIKVRGTLPPPRMLK
jgi:hypothetical protein